MDDERLKNWDWPSKPVKAPRIPERKLYGQPRSFAVDGISGMVIYAVTVKDHPSAVKIGQSAKWKDRRKSYANWNLRRGDGIESAGVFIITDEYVDLLKVEKAILEAMSLPRYRGAEWFTGTVREACEVIDRILFANDISSLFETE